MRKPWTFRRPWTNWASLRRREIIVPIDIPVDAEVQVPTRSAVYTAQPPSVQVDTRVFVQSVRFRTRRYQLKKQTVFRPKNFTIQRPVVLPLGESPIATEIFVPQSNATYVAPPPVIQIVTGTVVNVPLSRATYTALDPTTKRSVKVSPSVSVMNYTAWTPVVNPSPEPEEVKGGRPYLMRRRRRFILPNGTFFEGNDSEALERLRRFFSQQEKKDQLTKPKDERPTLPLMQEPEDGDILEAPVASPVMMTLPDLRVMQFQLQAQPPQSIDPQLLSVLLQRIDDEEAAMLLL